MPNESCRFSIATCTLRVTLLLALPVSLTAQSPKGEEFLPLPAPTIRIGAEGNPDYEFGTVGAVVRLPDGRLAAADWGRATIRIFDTKGRLDQKIGREGAGPGEFRSVTGLYLAGDTLIAYDWQLRRLSWFTAAGKLLRSVIIEPDASGGPIDLTGRFPNGRWLVTTPHHPSWEHGPGPYRDTLGVGILAATASGPVQWLGNYQGMTIFAHMPSQDKTRWMVGPLAWAASTNAIVMGDSILVSDNSQATLEVRGATGAGVRRIAIPLPPGSDPRHLRSAARKEAMDEARDPKSQEYVEAAYRAVWQEPRYESVLVADDGTLWIRLLRDAPGAPNRYLVMNRSGTVQARVRIGSRSRIRAIHGGDIVVVTNDENDVQQIEIIHWTPSR